MGTEDPQASNPSPPPPSADTKPETEASQDAGSEDWLLTDEEITLAAQAVKMYREGTWPTP